VGGNIIRPLFNLTTTLNMRHTHPNCQCLTTRSIVAFDDYMPESTVIHNFIRWTNLKYAKYMTNNQDAILIAKLKTPTLMCRLDRYLPGYIVTDDNVLPSEFGVLPNMTEVIEIGSFEEPTLNTDFLNKLS